MYGTSDDKILDLWPGRAPPFSGEALSSWFTRIALTNGLSPKDLYPICVPGARLYQLDLDRFPSPELAKNLSNHTGVTVDLIEKLNLNRFHGTVFADQPAKSRLSWLPPSGTTQKCFGQQICPICVKTDQTPYYRRHWRLSFVSACAIHKEILWDRCPGCGSSISPLRLPEGSSLENCYHCGTRFSKREQRGKRVNKSVLETQERLLSIASGQWFRLNKRHIHPVLFFKILHHIFRLVANSQFSTDLQQVLKRSIDLRIETGGIPRFKEIERYNPRCRQILIQLTVALFDNWPRTFVKTCKEVGLTRRRLLDTGYDLPFEYTRQVDEHLSFLKFELTEKDILAAANILKRRGIEPTYGELQKLLNHRFPSHRKLSSPVANENVPYGLHRYWKLDGISPDVRRAAKESATQAGEKIGPWVEGVLRKELEGKKG